MTRLSRRRALLLASAAGVPFGIAGTKQWQDEEARGDDEGAVDPDDRDLQAVREAGLDEAERAAWSAGNLFAGRYLGLPPLSKGHEHIHHIHAFQMRLLMRPTYARYREAAGFGGRAPRSGGELEELSAPIDAAEAAAAGLQPEEVECWQQLASFAACLKDLRKLHPMEDHELAHALHALRDSLLARPVLRAIRDA